MLSGTSAGMTETGTWFQDSPGQLFPQQTIFDQVTAEGMTWKNYFNDTPWELMLETLAHNPENLVPMDQVIFVQRQKNFIYLLVSFTLMLLPETFQTLPGSTPVAVLIFLWVKEAMTNTPTTILLSESRYYRIR